MLDRITKASLDLFKQKFTFESQITESDIFEHFINYLILESRLEDRIDEDFLEKINIGKNGTFGLDGFCILINKNLITSIEDLNEILDLTTKPNAEVYFIQSKTSNNFDVKEISAFGNSIEDFVALEQNFKWSSHSLDAISIFKQLTNRASELESNPKCYIYYATLGNYENDTNTEAQKDKILRDIKNQRVFESIDFNYYDHDTIHKEYKKIGQKISKTFNFSKKTLIPEIENVDEAYIGVIPVTTVINLIENENELITSIFYDNVRDFQGFNKINNEIKDTIQNSKLKLAFSILNNGITIVAEKLVTSRDNVTITNYQIINGLQTSRVLHTYKDDINSDMFVTIKLIVTQDENLISKIIRSTNRQTEVKEEDLIAYSDFQKKLEDYFKTFDEPYKLYYERRSKQYNTNEKQNEVEPKLIIDKSTLIKVMGSFYFLKPNLATRYFGALFKEFGKQLFKENHHVIPYYTGALIFNKIEDLFRNNKIDRKYRKVRYFILMMVRLEYSLNHPNFEAKKVTSYCSDLLAHIKEKDNLENMVKNALEKLEGLEIDLTNNETSKSTRLVENIKELYFS